MNDKSERIEKKEIMAFRRVTILMCLFGGTEEMYAEPLPGYSVPRLKFGSGKLEVCCHCVSPYSITCRGAQNYLRACVKRSTQVPC